MPRCDGIDTERRWPVTDTRYRLCANARQRFDKRTAWDAISRKIGTLVYGTMRTSICELLACAARRSWTLPGSSGRAWYAQLVPKAWS